MIDFLNSHLSFLLPLFESTFRLSFPIIVVALGGLMSERSGVIQIGLEGLMMMGGFAAAAVASQTTSPWLPGIAALVVGMVWSSCYAFSVIECKADQIVCGTALNLGAVGLIPILNKGFFNSTLATPSLESVRWSNGTQWWIVILCIFLVVFILRKTLLGLWIRFAGEYPDALRTAGISVKKVRWSAVLISGMLGALGGAILSIGLSSSYSKNMTAGRGFMALAAVIVGGWRPIPTVLACCFFGFTEALQMRLQGFKIVGDFELPGQWVQMLPYVATLVVLILQGLGKFRSKASAPSYLGKEAL